MTAVAGVLALFCLIFLTLLAVALDCNLTLRRRAAAATAAAKKSRLVAARDKADAARLRHSNKTLTASNEALRQHTAEHCRREAALKAVLQAAGWEWVDVAPEHVDVSDLDAAVSPADISWVPGQRDGGAR
jgi:CHASE1-domain containing sensor protein